jgi:hypothetical protein
MSIPSLKWVLYFVILPLPKRERERERERREKKKDETTNKARSNAIALRHGFDLVKAIDDRFNKGIIKR